MKGWTSVEFISTVSVGRLWGCTLLASLITHCWGLAKLWLCGSDSLKPMEKVWDVSPCSDSSSAALERACAKFWEVWKLRFWPVVSGCSWTESTRVSIFREQGLWDSICFGQTCFQKEKRYQSRCLITVLTHGNPRCV